MENACAVVMRNENMSLTHFHLQVNCILQERAEMLVDWLRFIIKFSRFSSYYIPKKEGAGMVRDMYISPLVEVIYICESLQI